jgi:hypothetical protein
VHGLHAALLKAINNQRGHSLYTRLGYQYTGPYRNEPGGPEFDLLLLQTSNRS